MQKRYLLLSLILVLVMNTYAQNAAKLRAEIENLNGDEAMKHAQWSLCVMPAKKDTVLAAYNSNASLIPASTMKIVTTGAALGMLGGKFRFETRLEYDGSFDSLSGILNGNLYITGGGDPTLESEYFKSENDTMSIAEKWAMVMKRKGIKKITGSVIGDASVFEDNMIPGEWVWGDMGNYYGAGACGLSYRDNKYSVYFNSGGAGSKTSISKMVPAIEGLEITNHVVADGKKDNAYIYGAPYTNYRTVEGEIPPNKNNYEVEGAIPDPALYCAQVFSNALKGAGIKVENKATTVRALKEKSNYVLPAKKTIYTHRSPTLDSIVIQTNLKSINLFAEAMLKYMCYKKTGMGREDEGTAIVVQYWKTKGADVSGFFMNDGCGLSRANVITTKTETDILRLMGKEKSFDVFYNSLPVAGQSGSLGGLCAGSFAENNLHAKSGYITRARGYAGYVKTKAGQMLCFSLLANNYDCTPTEMKKKLERILIAISEM